MLVFCVEFVNRRRVDVSGCGNSARATVPDVREQERFAADKNIEASPSRTGGGERGEERLVVVPIPRAVFHPDDCVRIRLKQALDQASCDSDHRDRWDMVEINSQFRIADALYDLAAISVETFFAHMLIVKWRK